MKIKTWLLLSYIIVMLLPIVAIYFLYASVTNYNDQRQVEEYVQIHEKIHNIIPHLENEALYEAGSETDAIDQIVDEQTIIALYNKDGVLLYHSEKVSFQSLAKDLLFTGLYELKQELRKFTYKQPVFHENEIIGFFQVEIMRDQLIQAMIKRSWLITAIVVLTFVSIYTIMATIVHRRINRRIEQLMNEMAAFARGNESVETPIEKDEIGELKQHFYAMRKQIVAAQEIIQLEQQAKEYMIASISHDLKTPLTSIKAYAESLDTANHLTNEEQAAYRKVIIEKADFIEQMLDDLMTHNLLQSKNYELDFVTVDGEEFFDMLVSDYEPLCVQKNIQLTSTSNVNGSYNVHPKHMIRVANNLMMNAIQHTHETGAIWIFAFSEADDSLQALFPFVTESYTFNFKSYAYLIVQNEGEGIKEENMKYLFEPLYQVDQARSKENTRGTGLGLSITQQIIEKHGGTVHAFSREKIGACFICAIPRHREG